eukprot:g38549.t1
MNAIYKFTDDTTAVGRISNNNNEESEYRKEVEGLVAWCNENNLSLYIGKTKELIIELRKERRTTCPIYINGAEVEGVKSIKFLAVTITDDLSWISHVDVRVKKTQQRLFFLRQLRKFDMSI